MRMGMWLWLAGLALSGLLGACAAPERISAGTYAASNGGTLTVGRNYIDLELPTKDKITGSTWVRCFYEVRPNGSVSLFGASDSSYLINVVGDWDWHWTGMEIQSKNRRDGTVVTYAPVKERPR